MARAAARTPTHGADPNGVGHRCSGRDRLLVGQLRCLRVDRRRFHRCPHRAGQRADRRRHRRCAGDGQPAGRGGRRAGAARRPRLSGAGRSGQGAGRARRRRTSPTSKRRSRRSRRASSRPRSRPRSRRRRSLSRKQEDEALPAAGQDRRRSPSSRRSNTPPISFRSQASFAAAERNESRDPKSSSRCSRRSATQARGAGGTGARRAGAGGGQSVAHDRSPRQSPAAIARLTAAKGNYAAVGQALMMFVPREVWVTANFKETQLRSVRPGEPVDDHDRRLSAPQVQRPRRQHPGRQRHRLQPAAGGKRDRQLRQDRAARAGQDRVRRAARRAARPRHVGRADRQGAMSDQRATALAARAARPRAIAVRG